MLLYGWISPFTCVCVCVCVYIDVEIDLLRAPALPGRHAHFFVATPLSPVSVGLFVVLFFFHFPLHFTSFRWFDWFTFFPSECVCVCVWVCERVRESVCVSRRVCAKEAAQQVNVCGRRSDVPQVHCIIFLRLVSTSFRSQRKLLSFIPSH